MSSHHPFSTICLHALNHICYITSSTSYDYTSAQKHYITQKQINTILHIKTHQHIPLFTAQTPIVTNAHPSLRLCTKQEMLKTPTVKRPLSQRKFWQKQTTTKMADYRKQSSSTTPKTPLRSKTCFSVFEWLDVCWVPHLLV